MRNDEKPDEDRQPPHPLNYQDPRSTYRKSLAEQIPLLIGGSIIFLIGAWVEIERWLTQGYPTGCTWVMMLVGICLVAAGVIRHVTSSRE